MKQIGITGGIGSGKTTVCQIFEMYGIPVYYADIEAKLLMRADPMLKNKIEELVGEEAYYPDGEINTQFIGKKIFANKALLDSMNRIVHPAVHLHAEQWAQKMNKACQPLYILREAALLVENGSYKALDALIVVTCPDELRINRVIKRDKLSREEVIKRINNQMPEIEKVKVADFVIINDERHALIPQIWRIHQTLTTTNI